MKQDNVSKPVETNYGWCAETFQSLWTQQTKTLNEIFPAAVEEVLMPGDEPTDVPILFVQKDKAVEVLDFMRASEGFNYDHLSDLTATDESPEDPRFHLVYQLFSRKTNSRIRIKVKIKENEKMPTLVGVWAGANWAEREVYDMFGVEFEGHPDLRRILMDVRWEGHPLRKDYPLRGYQVFPTPEPIEPGILEMEPQK